MVDLARVKSEIDRVCRSLPIKRLGLFGSAVTSSFGPSSDVDVLVVFDASADIDLFDKYFELKEKLEKIFDREVDLVIDRPFRNSVFQKEVEKTRTVVYER